MRQKRAKTYRKLMALYSNSFGFRQPYQVLVDSKMCSSGIELKIEIAKQLATVLQGDVKPMITQCCIHELYLQGRPQQPAVDLAKEFERRKCNHREPIPGDDCIASVVGDSNKHRYVIATQSHPLRIKLRNIPAVPIVHVNRTVMVLEPPSDVTIKDKNSKEEQALHPPILDLALIPSLSTEDVIPKKMRPKGPNPLSVKKKVIIAKSQGSKKEPGLKKYVRNTTDEDKARLGQKRKRDSIEGKVGEETSPNTSIGELPAKKRRRRRKVGDET